MRWQSLILDPIRPVLSQIGSVLASLVGAILILVIGWIVAKLIKNLIIRILKIIRIDLLAEQTGINRFLSKGGIKYNFLDLIGIIIYWLILLIALVVAINAIGLTVAADLINRIVLYVPNIIAAIFIIVLGLFAATFLSSMIRTAATNAGIEQAGLLGKIIQAVVVIFSIVIALEQLKIATTTIGLAINIILASLGLGFAIAFGLGCKDIVGKFVSDLIEKLKPQR